MDHGLISQWILSYVFLKLGKENDLIFVAVDKFQRWHSKKLGVELEDLELTSKNEGHFTRPSGQYKDFS